jgi:hypothetical protein
MNELNVICAYSGILFSLKKERNSDTEQQVIVLREICQSSKDKYCMILLMQEANSSQIPRDRR